MTAVRHTLRCKRGSGVEIVGCAFGKTSPICPESYDGRLGRNTMEARRAILALRGQVGFLQQAPCAVPVVLPGAGLGFGGVHLHAQPAVGGLGDAGTALLRAGVCF